MATQAATIPTRGILTGTVLGQALMHLLLLAFSVAAVVPFLWMAFGSLKPYKELTTSMDLLPHEWTLDNYAQIIGQVNFLTAFRNSVLVAVLTTLAVLLTSSLVGYVFATYHFPLKEPLFALLLATMMVPFAVVLIPLYIFISDVHLVDTLAAITVTGLWSTFGIFLLRQFMESIPQELVAAARIDGASEWRIYSQIVLPLSGAPLAALAILNVLGSWDSFLWPSVVLNSPNNLTIPLVLAGLKSLYWSRYDLWTAGAMLTVVPVMLVYAFASKQFIRGIALTGIKG